MKIRILNEKGNGLLDRNVSIVLNLAKKELDKGNDRNFYDILVAMVEEIKPYIQREHPSESDSPNPWHTGTPTEEGWYVLQHKGNYEPYLEIQELSETQIYILQRRPFFGDIVAWQKIEPYKEEI